MIASRILIQAEADPAAVVTGVLREVPGVWEAASVAARCNVRAAGDPGYRQAGRAGGFPRPGPGAGTRMMRCPVIYR